MRAEDRRAVRALALFSEMQAENFEALMKAAYLQRFPAQVDLISEGDRADFLHIVVDGCIELYSAANDKETTMAMIHPVSTFILAATIKDAPYLMSGRTVVASQVLLIPSEDIRRIFDEDDKFARAIVTELAKCYRVVVKTMKNLKLRTAIERVANYLIRLHQYNGETGSFTLQVGKRNLASMLGMTPENLSRAFNALQAHGVIVDGRRIEITSVEDLTAYARPTPLIDDMNS